MENEFDMLHSKNNRRIIPVSEEEQRRISRNKAGREIEKLHEIPYGVNYVLLDYAAWDIEDAFELNTQNTCLFATRGREDQLEEVAPYLFEYAGDTEFSKWLNKNEKAGENVLYPHSFLPLSELRKHLRRFLMVFTQRRERLFFRFYDPNVVPVIIPNLTDRQSCCFFSNISYPVYTDKTAKERKVITPAVEAKVEIDKKEKIIDRTLIFSDEQMELFKNTRVNIAIKRISIQLSRMFDMEYETVFKLASFHINDAVKNSMTDEATIRSYMKIILKNPKAHYMSIPDRIDEYDTAAKKIKALQSLTDES